MDKLNKYRKIIRELLTQYAEQPPSLGQVQTTALFDEQHDNYMVLDMGWDRTGRVHAVILHLQLRNGKIWIEVDGTETGIAQELLDAGVPKQDIVLAFYRPERRKLTEFAVA